MPTLVRPVSWKTSEWKKLVTESHQSSLFVLPEWLDAEDGHPIIIGAFQNGQLLAGLIGYEAVFASSAPYQGLLLTAGSTRQMVDSIIDWLEGVGGQIAVWNAPSMIDIRPWQVRPSPWESFIRYTHMLMTPIETYPRPLEVVEPKNVDENILDALTPLGMFTIETGKIYTDGDGYVLWGRDLQDRGYVLGFYGEFLPVIEALVRDVKSVDFMTTDSWVKRFKAKLRTIYGVVR